ncbi:MAG TPA: hypothetical protein VGN95_10930 [Pyrinomonadaceae bacterium]|nr:hypothetical protein [Pyrinomonadaceae bacterium]
MRLCLLSVAASVVLTACTEAAQQPVKNGSTTPLSQQPQTATAVPAQTKPDVSPSTTPSAPLADVRGALKRVYHDAVLLETSRSTPFVIGDFNGDDSPDIAIVVTPAKGKLPKINSELASWIVGDPQKVLLPEVRGDVKVFPKKPETVAVQQGDVLLAVIHGYQKEGWRNPLSAQTYLLKNAVGDEMEAQPARVILRLAAHRENLPPLRGDVIREMLAQQNGFIYWTGAKYAWTQLENH